MTAASDGKIAIINYALIGDYGVEWDKGAQAAADQLGLKSVHFDGRGDPAVQQDSFNQALTQGVKGTYILAADGGLVPTLAKSANDNEMHFAVAWTTQPWHTPWDSGPYYTEFIIADEQWATAETADLLFKAIGGEGTVVRIAGTPGADVTGGLRKAGFLDALANYPKVKFAGELDGKYDPQVSQEATASLLSKYPDTVGIAAINDDAAVGAIAAIRAAGKEPGKDIFVIGTNGSAQGVKNVRDGFQLATTGNVPSYASYQITVNLFDHLNGWKPDEAERMFTWKSVILTRDNVDPYLARYVDAPIEKQFSAPHLSRTLHPDDWDLQFEAYPIDDIDKLFENAQRKPDGYEYPAAYTKAKDEGAFDKIRQLYADHYKIDVLGPSPVAS